MPRIKIPVKVPYGMPGRFAVWIDEQNFSNKLFTHRTVRRLNNLWYAELYFLGLEDSEKAKIRENKKVKIFAHDIPLLSGTVTSVEYDEDYGARVKVKGLANKLVKHTTNETHTTTATETIFSALIPSDSGLTLDSTDNGAFGEVTVRFEDENNLKCIKQLSNSINYDWWEDWDYPYDNAVIHIKSSKGDTNTYTFNATGADANMVISSKEKDIDNLINSIIVLGAGDGTGQLKTECYHATTTRTTLASALTATATTVSLTDASSFPSSGNVWVGCEKIAYSGKSGNNLTGCTRAKAFNGNVEYTENVKTDVRGYAHDSGIFAYDAQYTKTSTQAGSSIKTNELHEVTTPKKELIDQNALDRMAQNIIADRKDAIERIVIETIDTFNTLGVVSLGDTVTATDAASGLSGTYKVVGQITGFDENKGEFLQLELSNKRVAFVDDVLQIQEEARKIGSYTQGVVTIYGIHHAENCDDSKALSMRFPIPAEVVGVNSVKLNFKIKPFRAYTDTSQTAASGGAVSSSSDSHTHTGLLTDAKTHTHTGLTTLENINWVENRLLGENGVDTIGNGGWTDLFSFTTTASPVPDVTKIIAVLNVGKSIIHGGDRQLYFRLWNDTNNELIGSSPGCVIIAYANLVRARAAYITGAAPDGVDFNNKTIKVQGYCPQGDTEIKWDGQAWEVRSHKHGLEISASGSHAHDLSISASGSHTHTGGAHTHDITMGFGIQEAAAPSGDVVVTCGAEGSETSVGTYDADQSEIDITQQVKDAITVGNLSWINLKFAPDQELMRIEASVYVEVAIRR